MKKAAYSAALIAGKDLNLPTLDYEMASYFGSRIFLPAPAKFRMF